MASSELRHRLESVFTPLQVEVLTDWAEEYQRNLVKTGDFNELKDIVRDLAEGQWQLIEAQQRTESKVEQLAEAQQRTESKVERLIEAQQRTEAKVEQLAEAQQRTEVAVAEMSVAVKQLAEMQAEMRKDINRVSTGLEDFRRQEGSNAQTLGYMLENEAYRNLPAWLARQHGIEVTGRMIRQVVAGNEIDLLVEARQAEEEILLVGETKSRLNPSDVGLLAAKVEGVLEQYFDLRGRRIVPLLVSNFASEKTLARAKQEGILVVQTFEW